MLTQLGVFLVRELVLLLDIFLVFIGALFLAGSHMSDVTIRAYSELGTLSTIILGVTTLSFSVRVFGQWQTVYWREAACGINRFSYFLAANIAQVRRLCSLTHVPSLLVLAGVENVRTV
jgi:hypothetical protein